MGDSQQLVARNVRRFRRERGLSMSALAQRAGLSKQTLSSIEHGAGNPTVETLGILSVALGVPIRRLLTEWGTPVYVQRAAEGTWSVVAYWEERMLDEVYGSGYVRTSLLRMARRSDGDRPVEPHSLGVLHHLYVVSGCVRTGPITEPIELEEGDFTRYSADVPHLLQVVSERAVVHLVTTEPQVRQVRD
jgi:transcriptional regulator with XRE-family HTH domain